MKVTFHGSNVAWRVFRRRADGVVGIRQVDNPAAWLWIDPARLRRNR